MMSRRNRSTLGTGVALALAIVLLIATSTAVAQDASQRLNPTGRDLELQTPVEDSGSVIGSITLHLGADDSIAFAAPGLLALLEPRLTGRVIVQLRELVDNQRLTRPAFESTGLLASFDQSRLTLVLGIPDSLRRVQSIRIGGQGANLRITNEPEPFSAFVNLNAAWSHFTLDGEDGLGEDISDQGFAATFDGLARLRGTVLAYEGAIEESASGRDDDWQVRRTGTRLLFDLPERRSRLSVGDVVSSGQRFLAPVDLLGVRLGREFSLSPGRNVRPSGQQRFTLNRPSTVEVLRDGEVGRRVTLAPGNYNLESLPLEAGNNQLALRITDDTGRVETLEFSQLFASNLLAPDEFDFEIYAGVLTEASSGGLDYRDDLPVAGGSLLAGLTSSVTGGFNTRIGEGAAQFGVALIRATPIGPIGLEAAVSDTDQRGSGQAIGVQYENIPNRHSAGRRISARLELRSRAFDTIEGIPQPISSEPSLDEQLGLDLALSQYLGGRTYGGLSLSHDRYHDDVSSANTVSLGLNGQLGATGRLSWNTRLSHREESDGSDEQVLTLGLSYRLDRRSALTTRAGGRDDVVELGYLRQTDIGRVGGYSTDVVVSRDSEEQARLDTRLAYTANRFRARLDHASGLLDVDTGRRRSTTTAFVQSAVAVAGNSISIGRPISESFAVVRTHPSLEGRRVRIAPGDERETARTDRLGSALIPDLGLYTTRNVDFDVDELPLGYDLGDGLFTVRPPLGAGYRLRVGSGATVTVIGVLVDADSSEPLSLVTGKAVLDSDPLFEPVDFFSNRSGKFAISGLKPGRYRLELATSPRRNVELIINEDQASLMRLDTLAVP